MAAAFQVTFLGTQLDQCQYSQDTISAGCRWFEPNINARASQTIAFHCDCFSTPLSTSSSCGGKAPTASTNYEIITLFYDRSHACRGKSEMTGKSGQPW